MIPRELLATAAVPGGGGELRLFRRGDEFTIMLGSDELMNSRRTGSEEALAAYAAEALGGRPKPRILIGGLGLGFTLRTALVAFGKDAAIDVAELVPEVVEWARGPLAGVFGDSLADPRTTIIVDDVAAVMAAASGRYDAILLDVDNGPAGLTRPQNDRLYGSLGLAAARRALRPRGVLVVWSAQADDRFTGMLRRAGYSAMMSSARNHNGRGAKHTIWIAKREEARGGGDGPRPAAPARSGGRFTRPRQG